MNGQWRFERHQLSYPRHTAPPIYLLDQLRDIRCAGCGNVHRSRQHIVSGEPGRFGGQAICRPLAASELAAPRAGRARHWLSRSPFDWIGSAAAVVARSSSTSRPLSTSWPRGLAQIVWLAAPSAPAGPTAVNQYNRRQVFVAVVAKARSAVRPAARPSACLMLACVAADGRSSCGRNSRRAAPVA